MEVGLANQWATNVFKTDRHFNVNYHISHFCSEILPTLTYMKKIGLTPRHYFLEREVIY